MKNANIPFFMLECRNFYHPLPPLFIYTYLPTVQFHQLRSVFQSRRGGRLSLISSNERKKWAVLIGQERVRALMIFKNYERELERERQYFKLSASATYFDKRTKAMSIAIDINRLRRYAALEFGTPVTQD